MRPRLVLGLGGELAGDDAVGLLLADRLAADPRLPDDVQVAHGGADLLRLGTLMAGREQVWLLDAVEALPGELAPLTGTHPLPALDQRQTHAHHLSAAQALDLLLLSEPALAATRFRWFLVPIGTAHLTGGPSPALLQRLPDLLEILLARLRDG